MAECGLYSEEVCDHTVWNANPQAAERDVERFMLFAFDMDLSDRRYLDLVDRVQCIGVFLIVLFRLRAYKVKW